MHVLIFGTFDHLHPGHLFVIHEAQKRGDLHIVVARDQNVEHIKGRKPDHSLADRIAALKEAAPNAHVVEGHETHYLEPIQRIEPDLILLGYDQKLPPGITEEDLPCKVERLDAFEPEKYKSSLIARQ